MFSLTDEETEVQRNDMNLLHLLHTGKHGRKLSAQELMLLNCGVGEDS